MLITLNDIHVFAVRKTKKICIITFLSADFGILVHYSVRYVLYPHKILMSFLFENFTIAPLMTVFILLVKFC